MKPVNLIMSAFGSYAEETVIDFKQAEHGLFLIAGDTGSGKTTIFDAICYALYDRTSGGQREGADMRSQYAMPDTPTFVQFTFSYGEDTYTIKRNPKYTRISKRKDKDGNYKTTTEQPSIELILPDGSTFAGKVKETNEKIIEIIGLDAEQFTQIAMIAQGEFMRLLQAPSNKRKEIFSRIFQTKIYWQIQEELRRRAKEGYAQLEDNRKYLEHELQSVKSEIPFIFQETNTQEILDSLQRLVTEGKALEKTGKEQQTSLQKKLDETNSILAAALEINRLFKQLEQVREEQQLLQTQTPIQGQRVNAMQAAKKAQTVWTQEEKRNGAKQALEDCQKKKQEIENALAEATKQMNSLLQKKEEATKEKQEKEPVLQQQLTKSKETIPLYEEAEAVRKQAAEQEKKTKDIQAKATQAKETLEKKQQSLIVQHQKVTDALQAYQNANDTFIAEQAGIMAQALQEDMPCPVCGSLQHPQKASLSSQAVTQNEVNAKKEIWMKEDQKESRTNQELQTLRQDVEKLLHLQQEAVLLWETLKVQQNNKEERLLFQTKEEALLEMRQLEQQLKKIQDNCTKAENEWLSYKEKVTTLSGAQDTLTEQLGKTQQEYQTAQEAYEQSRKQQGFTTQEQYAQAKLSPSQIEKLEQQIAEYHDRVVSNEASRKQLEQQTQDREVVDVSEISKTRAQLEQQKKELEQTYKEQYSRNQRNQEALEKVTVLLEKRKQLIQTYTLISNLDKTANGNLSGTAKIDFQTYIQRRYFEKMIQEANRRLIKMTSGQFILQCRELDKLGTQGAVGLDLDVYSLVTDKTRDVKTLSGGESFMAALAMALGMSDVIQNTAGKIRLDTMFVDEGFGSLDDDARQEAMKILTELAGNRRLVGIISHVTELKEQIDRKLMVEKTDHGSTAYWSES